MQKLLSIFFLAILLTANTTFVQILRLPTLVHHYWEHVEWDNSSLVEFISEHYAKQINHPDDKHHDHQNLPFKALDCQASHIVSIVPQPAYNFPEVIQYNTKTKRIIHKSEHYPNAHLDNIWQPPRIS